MIIIEKEVIINWLKDEVWDILVDYGNIYCFNFNFKLLYCILDIVNGLGVIC